MYEPPMFDVGIEISALKKEIDRLQSALRPFVEADWYAGSHGKFEGRIHGDALDAARAIPLPNGER